MSQIKLLLDIISDVRSLGNSLQAYADALTASKVIGDLNDYEEIGTSSETPKQTEEPEKPIDRSKVRAKLAELTRLGFLDEVKALLQKHSAERLSAVPDTELSALLKEAEALGSKA